MVHCPLPMRPSTQQRWGSLHGISISGGAVSTHAGLTAILMSQVFTRVARAEMQYSLSSIFQDEQAYAQGLIL